MAKKGRRIGLRPEVLQVEKSENQRCAGDDDEQAHDAPERCVIDTAFRCGERSPPRPSPFQGEGAKAIQSNQRRLTGMNGARTRREQSNASAGKRRRYIARLHDSCLVANPMDVGSGCRLVSDCMARPAQATRRPTDAFFKVPGAGVLRAFQHLGELVVEEDLVLVLLAVCCVDVVCDALATCAFLLRVRTPGASLTGSAMVSTRPGLAVLVVR